MDRPLFHCITFDIESSFVFYLFYTDRGIGCAEQIIDLASDSDIESDVSVVEPRRKRKNIIGSNSHQTAQDRHVRSVDDVLSWTESQVVEWDRSSWNSDRYDEETVRARQTPYPFYIATKKEDEEEEKVRGTESRNDEQYDVRTLCWQPLYDELLKLYAIKFVEGLPESFNDDDLLPVTKTNLLILDDLMNEAGENKQVEKVFTQFVHHRNLSAIYIVQNLFAQGKTSRTISLNTNFMILFKDPRDAHQVAVLGRQMYPGNAKYFMECYQDATSRPFGYLMIDYKAKTPEQYRLRTGLLSDRQVVYLPKKRRT
ncbi:hypothetical protein DPX16_1217 [Anabarilius grahami]|uniref:Uncharacterized protein n=1 Tax=Anabarilius grahami TaxID=495550 RepID=A0A3N0XVD1_ANAGA|nr:hypothetical protein DPX16_1217 [Anabarilius grahami]